MSALSDECPILDPSRFSSDNLIADRRYELARGYAEDGDQLAAAELFAQTRELVPDWIPAILGEAEARAALGEREKAERLLVRVVELDPDGLFGAPLKLAILGAVRPPEHPPEAYVRGLFDHYADRFEKELVETLGYRAPWLIAAALDAVRPGGRYAHGIDLGCGTGLMAEVLGARVGRHIGCDLSPEMTARAAPRFAEVMTGDVVDCLLARPERFDLVTAADVFVYVGALDAVFAAVRDRLAPGGLMAFTVEDEPTGALTLRPSLRYAHGEGYVRRMAEEHGFEVKRVERAVLRMDRGEGVRGLVCVVG
jgi:predicted TPR repeat methyltransferase